MAAPVLLLACLCVCTVVAVDKGYTKWEKYHSTYTIHCKNNEPMESLDFVKIVPPTVETDHYITGSLLERLQIEECAPPRHTYNASLRALGIPEFNDLSLRFSKPLTLRVAQFENLTLEGLTIHMPRFWYKIYNKRFNVTEVMKSGEGTYSSFSCHPRASDTLEDMSEFMFAPGRVEWRLEISWCPPPRGSYAGVLRAFGVNFTALNELALYFVPETGALRDSHFAGLKNKTVAIHNTRSSYTINIKDENITLSSGEEVTLTCSFDDKPLEDQPPILAGRTVSVAKLRVGECPPPRHTYTATLKALGVDFTSPRELNLRDVREPTTLRASHLAGFSGDRLLISSEIFEYQANGTLSTAELIQIKCLKKGTLADIPAVLPPRVRALSVARCPPPRESYVAALKALGVDVATLEQLDLRFSHEATLSAAHFESLSLQKLSIHYARKVLDGFLEPLAPSLLEFSAKYMSVPPMPAVMRLVNVSLYGGEATGGWGGCEELRRLEVDWKFKVPEVTSWLANCTRLYTLTLNRLTSKDARRALSGARSLHALSVTYCDLVILDEKLFVDAVDLRQLNLTGNALIAVYKEAFKSLVHLEALCLADNHLTQQVAPALRPLHALRVLHLEKNLNLDFCANFTGAPMALERLTIQWTGTRRLCFHEWDSLVLLNVSHCNLIELQLGELPFSSTHALQVDLRHNYIGRLVRSEKDTGDDTSSYEQLLDLRVNKLQRLDVAATTALFSIRARRVRLAGNPLLCDCDNRALLAALRDHRDQVKDFKNITCAVDGRALALIMPDELCSKRWLPVTLLVLGVGGGAALGAAVFWKRRSRRRNELNNK